MSDASPGNSVSETLAGRELGDFRLLSRLGRGGMAEVYLAQQRSLGRKVAVKVLRRELSAQEDYVRRFHNEARAAAALVHANIVQIYEVGCVDGIHFIAQEYVQGQTVKQLVSRSGPLQLPRAVSILRQTAAALNKAGQENIIHRDIKPENILLMPTGEVKVADFGLARVIDPTKPELTQIGLTMGTPLYMSPEQVEGKPLDARSDLYSFGVTAFYLLAGRPPFQGDTPLSIAVQHLQTPPPDLSQLRPDLPKELCDIVSKLLAKKPRDRYRSAADLLRDLRALKVDGAEYHLPLEADALPEEQADALESGLEATRELQSLMQTQALLRVRPARHRGVLAVGLLLTLLLGGVLARLTWPGPLLRVDPGQSQTVARKATAEEQFIAAVIANTEDAWRGVARFHPPEASPENKYYSRRALQQLALFYLDGQQLDHAFAAFGELANVEPAEREFRAIGLAGQAIIHDLRNESAPLSAKLADVWNDRDALDSDLRSRLEGIIEKRGIKLDAGGPRPEPPPRD